MKPYQDATLPIEERLSDLLGRMTIREKVRQTDMVDGANLVSDRDPITRRCTDKTRADPEKLRAIVGSEGIGCIHDLVPHNAALANEIQRYCRENTRLGIPVLISEEGLHGAGGAGNTILPQMIAMAATFNRDLVRQAGAVIAAEMRARGIHLTFSPVLEIARDPRWGRTEETFGEDTHLAGELAYSIVKGLQGESLADVTSIVAEPKHFAVHSISSGGLNCAPVSVGEREVRRDFLPVFERAVKDAGAKSVMCAYHALDGVPCAAHAWLLKTVLRDEWGFDGFVCSDLGAIRRLFSIHKTAASEADAIRQSFAAGMDMQFYDFEHAFYQDTLVSLVEDGHLSQQDLDRAAAGILRVKFMLGLFDQPYVDKTRAAQTARCPEHRRVALEAARECICLLKNDGILPLKPERLRRIALIGPSIFDTRLGDYTSDTSKHEIPSVCDALRALLPDTEMMTEKGVDIVFSQMEALSSNHLITPDAASRGLLGEYFNNTDFSGPPAMTRIDERVDFNFIMQLPDSRISSDAFAVRWTGFLLFDKETELLIGLATGDEARLSIDGQLVAACGDGQTERVQSIRFKTNMPYAVRIEYIKKKGGGARIVFGKSENTNRIENAVRIARESDVAIVVCGESNDVCGESKDRRDIALPGLQRDLILAVANTGTPVVLVLMNGRPLTIRAERDASAAVIEAWYPGEDGARAVGEVLLGLTNPSGKLPISFPETVGQLPIHYNRLNGTPAAYIDGSAAPLYAFGHGLSYTTFTYSDLQVDASPFARSGRVIVAVNVENSGNRDGKETVLLFVSDLVSSTVKARTELKAWEKISLARGETKRVRFELGVDAFRTLDPQMRWRVEPGEFTIRVGGSLDQTLSASVCL